LCVLLSACEQHHEDPPNLLQGQPTIVGTAAQVYELGATAHARDYSLRVLNVQECHVAPHFAPPPGLKKLGIEVEIGGSSAREVPVNPFYAVVVASSGERYEATLAGCSPALPAGRVVEKQTQRGWLTFDVPVSVGRLELSYEPVVLGVGREQVRFDLDD
jgi:hypothetical protein